MLRSGIDNKIHHLKELEFIERTLYNDVIDVNGFYKGLSKFLTDHQLDRKLNYTTADLRKVDEFVESYFLPRIDESRVWLLRAYVVGRLLSESDVAGTVFDIGMISRMPKFIKDASQKYGLTLTEAKAMQNAIEFGAVEMTNSTLSTRQGVRNMMVENAKRRGSSDQLAKLLRENITSDIGELNRDWQRVAITELNNVFNNGYLSTLKGINDFVVGISLPDACQQCMDLINGKVYRVRSEPAPDYREMVGEEYAKWAKVWDTEIWEGKNNYGRSPSQRKRIDKKKGNSKDNLIEKEHHEFSTPCLPLHPSDRCRWISFNPNLQFVDKHGQVKLKVQDPEEWNKFNNNLKVKFSLK